MVSCNEWHSIQLCMLCCKLLTFTVDCLDAALSSIKDQSNSSVCFCESWSPDRSAIHLSHVVESRLSLWMIKQVIDIYCRQSIVIMQIKHYIIWLKLRRIKCNTFITLVCGIFRAILNRFIQGLYNSICLYCFFFTKMKNLLKKKHKKV